MDMVVGCWEQERRDRSSSSHHLNSATVHLLLPMDISQVRKPDYSSLATWTPWLAYSRIPPVSRHKLAPTIRGISSPIWPNLQATVGGKLCVVLNSSSLAKEVTRDKDTVFSNHDPPIVALACTYGGVDIMWSPYGSYWCTMRKLFVREMLSNTSLEDTYNLRRDEVKRTIREFTVDSQRDDSIGIEFRAVILKMVELLAKPNMSDFFLILARFDVQGMEREMKRLLQWVERILDPILEARMKISRGEGDQEDRVKGKGKKDFIQILLELKEQEDVSVPITLQQIKAMKLGISFPY
ncbi:hypothetical protein RHSIM_Rhsim04G0178100 [Rhododendron simsii]|uniref:Cytochrome P450 n=1 Tax=Rhododendron simsii TaxID=118357 RepID=A0A834H266_RHOSS|nr:hypothetical protein RHSIM_Rhsim04G0178100 [Rhododendron simsii]